MDRAWQASVRFGMSKEQYLELEEENGGHCEICGKTAEENGKKLAMDHDHGSGKFRGFLCHLCNIGLGAFLDNPQILRKAIGYLTVREVDGKSVV